MGWMHVYVRTHSHTSSIKFKFEDKIRFVEKSEVALVGRHYTCLCIVNTHPCIMFE